ncbi:MAG: glycosyl transferase [Candidatus Parcubacteria bacterium]|nr:MAG: glycosyl transferase [Candidatus Parcubacteria bacterium]
MNIGINLLFLYEMTGIGVYVKNLLENLGQIDKEDNFFIFVSRTTPKEVFFNYKNFKYITLPVNAKKKLLRVVFEQIILPFLTLKYKLRVLFTPSIFHPIFSFCSQVLTLHDISFILNREFSLKNFYFRLLLKSASRVKAIITVSRFSQKEILDFYKNKKPSVFVVYEGVPQLPLVKTNYDNKILEKLGVRKPYFFYIGLITPYKNIDGLLETFGKFSKEHQEYNLILSGRIVRELIDPEGLIKKLNLGERVILTGIISDEEKVILMRNASAFVFISTYEGFGLPILEAQSLGVPVLTSNLSALPEIGGEGALYVNPFDIEEIVRGMKKISFDRMVRKTLIEKGYDNIKRFSFTKTADETLKIIKMTAKNENPSS